MGARKLLPARKTVEVKRAVGRGLEGCFQSRGEALPVRLSVPYFFPASSHVQDSGTNLCFLRSLIAVVPGSFPECGNSTLCVCDLLEVNQAVDGGTT